MMRPLPNKANVPLVLAALGVVFGDIGTSPLYAMREAFSHSGLATNSMNILGVLSLMIWSLILVVTIKYLLFVMRAHNKGEGGVLALTALLSSTLKSAHLGRRSPLILVGIFGAALLFGDGVITPAVTILGAVEGLNVATPFFEPYVVPLAITVLVVLFWAQHYGTARIGAIFGPIILLWFLSIGGFGILGILKAPIVLEAFNPMYAFHFCFFGGSKVLIVLGAVFLTTTGAEALYADMGHFGPTAIRRAWCWVALPGLLLNYLGQGALLLSDPKTVANPFYYLVPTWALYPMVFLATVAAVIASQALITGVFSITQQAIHLGFLPRLKVIHTSMSTIGQVYLPQINWTLLILTIWLVVTFQSSSNLVAAYGIAVSLTMFITTVLACMVAYRLWKWHPVLILTLFIAMIAVDTVFLSANALKIQHGGWFPLALAVGLFVIMTTWKKGRLILFDYLKTQTIPFEDFSQQIKTTPPARVSGTAIFMSVEPKGVPLALLHNVKHNKVLHEKNIFLTVYVEEVPFVRQKSRLEITSLEPGFFRMAAHYGFMEKPDIYQIFAAARDKELHLEMRDTIFFLGKETIIATESRGMALWREKLFSFMSRNAEGAILFFNLPRQQVVELGVQIEL